jgi:hypothetical protein
MNMQRRSHRRHLSGGLSLAFLGRGEVLAECFADPVGQPSTPDGHAATPPITRSAGGGEVQA